MKSILKIIAISMLLSSTAQAGLFTDGLIINDGMVDTLQDNSASFARTWNGTSWVIPGADHVIGFGTGGVGDIITGVLRITQSNTTGKTYTDDEQLSILFSAQIKAAATKSDGSETIYDLGAVDPADGTGLSIEELLTGKKSDGITASQFAAGTFSADTIFAILESNPNSTNVTFNSFTDNLDQFKTAGLYTLDLTGGIVNNVGGENASGSTDFFQATLYNVDGSGGVTVGELLPGGGYLSEGDEVGKDSGAFSVILNPLGLTYLPVSVQDQGFDTAGVRPFSSHSSDVTFTATLNVPTVTPGGGQVALGYTFANQTFVKLNALPEPSSLALLSLGLGAVGIAKSRRRKARPAKRA